MNLGLVLLALAVLVTVAALAMAWTLPDDNQVAPEGTSSH